MVARAFRHGIEKRSLETQYYMIELPVLLENLRRMDAKDAIMKMRLALVPNMNEEHFRSFHKELEDTAYGPPPEKTDADHMAALQQLRQMKQRMKGTRRTRA